jgi:2-methylcitrate dehydratase
MYAKLARREFLLVLSAIGLMRSSWPADAASASQLPVHPLAERLAAYASDLRFDDIDPVTLEAVKSHVIDTLGCAIGALDEEPVRICREIALIPGAGASTIIGTSKLSTPDLAAFANTAASRYFDLNDTYAGTDNTHPSDTIPACFAVAEFAQASGSELAAAIVLAYEINCRLADNIPIADRGWDSPIYTLPAVALAAGRLMRLDREKLTQAVNIALNDHLPMRQTRMQTLSDWKGLGGPEAARNAVFATMLARRGLTGPAPIFEGRAGFFRQVSGGLVDVNVDAFGRSGIPFKINQCSMKAYPAQFDTQTAIVAATEVARDAGDVDRISAVEVATTRRGYLSAGSEPEKWAPQNRETADHSLPYITARAMFDGDIANESYIREKLRDPRILAFMRRITVKEDPQLTAAVGKEGVPTRVTATLDDGRRIVRQVNDIPGFPGRPMQRAGIERKFRGNMGKRLPEERVASALLALWDLDHVSDVRAVMRSFSLDV